MNFWCWLGLHHWTPKVNDFICEMIANGGRQPDSIDWYCDECGKEDELNKERP